MSPNFIPYLQSRLVRPMKSHEQAKAWRVKRKLSLQELADLTGYSIHAIYKFEAGCRAPSEEHSDWTWRRYRLACSGAERQIKSGRAFEW